MMKINTSKKKKKTFFLSSIVNWIVYLIFVANDGVIKCRVFYHF